VETRLQKTNIENQTQKTNSISNAIFRMQMQYIPIFRLQYIPIYNNIPIFRMQYITKSNLNAIYTKHECQQTVFRMQYFE